MEKNVVITSCTHRKRASPAPELQARSLPRGNLDAVAKAWHARLNAAEAITPARQLYCGRGFAEAVAAADAMGADLAIVSAGLGVVCDRAAVPSYSMTLSDRSPDGLARIISEKFVPADWWRSLTKSHGASLASVACDHSLTIVALPETYLALVAEDLIILDEKELRGVRLIGPRSGERVPSRLCSQLLPYDERFESIRPGTNADFAQRCARHFANQSGRHCPLPTLPRIPRS